MKEKYDEAFTALEDAKAFEKAEKWSETRKKYLEASILFRKLHNNYENDHKKKEVIRKYLLSFESHLLT